ncbi:MAG: DUF86 domain-containing protein [Candidatus Methanosuratincola sp.]|nr:DUF86 domain-containing protein [Candidatus Methanosuratincola sp.]
MRDYDQYLNDILDSISWIEEYTSGMTFDQFRSDRKTVDAVVRNFEIIGEASRHVPEELREKYPDVEWKAMAGMRNYLAHEYFGISLEIIWRTIEERLPGLRMRIREILDEIQR